MPPFRMSHRNKGIGLDVAPGVFFRIHNTVISLRFPVLGSLILFTAVALSAQTLPTATQPFASRSLAPSGPALTLDLREYFNVPGISGQVAQVETVVGTFNVELFDDTPQTKANFLAYINAGRYANTIIHRSVAGFVIQTGGYFSRLPVEHIATFPPVQNEFRRSNLRGTLAMAKLEGDPNSATSEWFVNLGDNSANLDGQNGGFTVFGRVIGSGMQVVDAIAALTRYSITGALTDVPLRDVASNQTSVEVRNFITINTVTAVPIYPTGTGRSVLTFLAQSSDPTVATASISGSTLTVTPLANGTSALLIRARDTNNNVADSTLTVTVGGSLSIVTPPQSQNVQVGAPIALSVTSQGGGLATYQWSKNGVPIASANSFAYIVPSATAADMGFYTVTVSSGGVTLTPPAAIVTVAVPGTSRLVNVSTRGSVTATEALTPGFVMRGTGTKRLVIRAVGPTLSAFQVPGALTDPRMDVIPLNQSTVILANDDWQNAPAADVSALVTTSAAVSAFALPPAGSKDSATLASLPVTNSGGYTVRITPAGTATAGVALAEIYDADGPNSPVRLINVSTLGRVTADGLTPGFVIGGTAPKQLLIRAVGPTLTAFNVTGELADPQLTIYPLGLDIAIARNNDWQDDGQGNTLQAAFKAAGAFDLTTGSRDAAVLVRLPPGAYTAVASGVGGTTGQALVEVYDLDP